MKKDDLGLDDELRPEYKRSDFAELVPGEPIKRRDLSDIAGTWVPDSAIDEALEDQRLIDPELWPGLPRCRAGVGAVKPPWSPG